MFEEFVEYKLLQWIDINKLDWAHLSANPNAILILEQNLDKINWPWLSENPNARDAENLRFSALSKRFSRLCD